MSRQSAFSAPTQDDQSGRRRQGTFSLAGPTQTQQATTPYRTQSYVTQDYESYHAGYDYPEKPVWSLATPFPHLVRGGMRTREHQLEKPSSEQQPVCRPDSNVSAPTRLAANQSPPPAQSGRARNTSFPRRLAALRETQSNAGRGNTVESHMSAQELLKIATANASGQSDQNQGTGETDHQEIAQHASHDFGTGDDGSQELHLTASEEEQMEAGRQKLQDRADDIAGRTSILGPLYGADVDWEDIHDETPEKAESKAPTNQESPKFFNTWGKYRYILREPLAEFLGTFIFMIFGLCANLVPHIADDNASGSQYGDFVSTNLAWAWGAMTAIYVAGGISGAHLNPATSIVLAIYRGFPWKYCLRYILAQILAAFLATFVVYAIYADALAMATHATNSHRTTGPCDSRASCTQNVFYATPDDSIGPGTIFFSQFLAAALFTCCVFAMGDDRNAPPGNGMNAFVIGLLVFVLCAAFPYNTSMNLSPARDLGPRLAMSMLWKTGDMFTERHWYWIWGCWLGPLSGSFVGAGLYDICIFTGGESPVNYPYSAYRPGLGLQGVKELRISRRPADGEKAKESV